MTSRLAVRADLRVEVTLPGHDPLRGAVRGAGQDLTLHVDRPERFAGSPDAAPIRLLADALAARGLRLHVESPERGRLVTLGAVRAPWWQRPATRSRHLRIDSLRGALTAVRGRARLRAAALPAVDLRPPGTVFPLAPTFLRRPRRLPTTTHDPAHGGGPRLVVVAADGIWAGEPRVFWLQRELITIGSDPHCDVVLPGLLPVHAEVRHDDADEYVLLARGRDVRVYGARVREQLLRTSARVELGAWVLAYYREEFADHGRPYGGRIGGELGHQRPQPPRPR